MAQNTRTIRSKNGKESTFILDANQPVGKRLYLDSKRRTIYLSPLLHEALYLPKYDFKRFNQFRNRYFIAAATLMIAVTVFDSWFKLPVWGAFVLAALVFAVFEYRFFKFQKTLSVVKDFDKSKAVCTETVDITKEAITKAWLKAVLYLALGVLLVLNAYEQHYSDIVIYACWAALVLCIVCSFNIVSMILRSKKEAASTK